MCGIAAYSANGSISTTQWQLFVEYSGDTQLCYSLHSYTPFEGWRMGINGEKGRLELSAAETFCKKNSPNFKERVTNLVSQDPYKGGYRH